MVIVIMWKWWRVSVSLINASPLLPLLSNAVSSVSLCPYVISPLSIMWKALQKMPSLSASPHYIVLEGGGGREWSGKYALPVMPIQHKPKLMMCVCILPFWCAPLLCYILTMYNITLMTMIYLSMPVYMTMTTILWPVSDDGDLMMMILYAYI